MNRNRSFAGITLVCVVVAALLFVAPQYAYGQYQKPPKAILDVLHAPVTPQVRINPTRDTALMIEPVRYPPIAELAEPMLRLAGLRISPATNGRHNTPSYVNFTLKRISDGKETKVIAPPGGKLGSPSWSPDGKLFAVPFTTPTGIELLIGDASTGALRKIAGVKLNGVLQPYEWMPGSTSLLCWTVPAGRAKPPAEPAVPAGPNVQENFGRAAPAPTFQDLLKDAHDEDLFEYYATAQLVIVDAATGKTKPLGKPGIISGTEFSPSGKFLLVNRIHRPFSFLRPFNSFATDVEVWDLTGNVVHKVHSRGPSENIPLGGVEVGPRNVTWSPAEPSTLVWVEALDDGDPRKKVPNRDKVITLRMPTRMAPTQLAILEHRYAGMSFGENGDLAILREFDRDRNWARVWFLDLKGGSAPRKVWDLSVQDRYNNPGNPVMRTLPNGQAVIHQSGDYIFLAGPGATPQGDRPFLDRFDTKTLKSERLFRCDDKSYESFVALLSPDGSRYMTSYETPTEPANYFVRTAGSDAKLAFTNFKDPTPQLRAVKKELVKYKRADGVDLSFTLYLPPDYKPGERRPAVVWAYPLEFASADVAGQVSGSTNRFTTIGGASQLFYLLAGYVVLNDTSMPVVGDPETVNNTYVEQIVSSAKAAIDKAAEMGVIDPDRVGVGGHSYGAFMTANLLAHSDVFRAGVARSGAYNRTLTPFGFQSERRTIWQAAETYIKMSPFMFANKIKEPILLIHGEADNNTGTFPIQSERMYAALKGNGGNVRYVTLPHEAHGYAARESIEHTLFEMISWFDKYVKNAGPRDQQRAGQ